MTQIIALEAGQSIQWTFEPITPAQYKVVEYRGEDFVFNIHMQL